MSISEKEHVDYKFVPLSGTLNKFREITSPEDLHICRIRKRAISSSPADSYLNAQTNV
jgi:hypothetical protein